MQRSVFLAGIRVGIHQDLMAEIHHFGQNLCGREGGEVRCAVLTGEASQPCALKQIGFYLVLSPPSASGPLCTAGFEQLWRGGRGLRIRLGGKKHTTTHTH